MGLGVLVSPMPDPIIHDVSYYIGPNFPPSGRNKDICWFVDSEANEADRQKSSDVR